MKIPEPAPGLVIGYAYLWRAEARRGEDSGRKDRPCVIVLTVQKAAGETRVTVAPITHRPPSHEGQALELPSQTKRRLGLDEQRSWIVLDDLNQFAWPGSDLRPVGRDRPGFIYGPIPQTLLATLRDRIARLARSGAVALTSRDR